VYEMFTQILGLLHPIMIFKTILYNPFLQNFSAQPSFLIPLLKQKNQPTHYTGERRYDISADEEHLSKIIFVFCRNIFLNIEGKTVFEYECTILDELDKQTTEKIKLILQNCLVRKILSSQIEFKETSLNS